MGIAKDKRDYKYPYIENADEKLRDLCVKGLEARYSGEKREMAMTRLNEELSIISRQGSTSGYLILLDVLETVGFEPGDICLRATDAASLIFYVTGLSTIEPLESKPALYPEFYFGFDGERLPAFEMNVTPELQDRLLDYYKHYSGDLHLAYRFDNEIYSTLGVFMGDFDENEVKNSLYYGVFRFLFMRMGDRNHQPSELIKEEIFDACNPKTFTDYVKCYGLAHGTNVWEGNAENLLKDGTLLPSELIADREDVYEYLIQHGFEKRAAFEIAESVRKGRIHKSGWKTEQLEALREKEVPEWFIESCKKIQYLFPRAHAMGYLKTYCNMGPEKKDR